MNVLAIDPGNVYSAYAIIDTDYNLLAKGKVKNRVLETKIKRSPNRFDVVVIEMIASYGMAVGETVFETCVEIGRLMVLSELQSKPVERIKRIEVKMNLCHQTRAKDSNIIQALKDRFGEVGRKNSPGYFYGVSKDMWQAIALGVTYIDRLKGTQY